MNTSKYFTIVDVPDPQKITAKFVYNFFVNNERIDDSGKVSLRGESFKKENSLGNVAQSIQEKLGKSQTIKERNDLNGVLHAEVPRYIEVSFNHVTIDRSDETSKNSDMSKLVKNPDEFVKNSEETITNRSFASLRENDESAIERLKQKTMALSNVMGITFESSEQSKNISITTGIPQTDIQNIISPLNDPAKLMINSRPAISSIQSVFEIASLTRIQSQVNKNLIDVACRGADDTSPLSSFDTAEMLKKVNQSHLASAHQFAFSIDDTMPTIEPFGSPILSKTTMSPGIIGASVMGYLIDRHQYDNNGSVKETKKFILAGADNTTFLDAKIVYGSSYSYEVRSIIKVVTIADGHIEGSSSSEKSRFRVSFVIVSRPCSSVRIRTEEFDAPKEPDGVFYNFNYDKEKGLKIRWQIPSGKSRDVKYFQIFKRKSIFDPFMCISQIDFNDSLIKTNPREYVRSDKIIDSASVLTFYEDMRFDRDSKWIYAVAAVDAHGMTSGYSAQTEVEFNKTKNVLMLKLISRGGAPKQYPNFYVDPKLDDNITVNSFSQDAIFDSGHTKMKIYFSPDSKSFATSKQQSEDTYVTKNQNGSYVFHFINLDLQKAASTKISITDTNFGK